MAFDDGIKVGPIAYIGGVSVIVTFVLVLLLQVLYYGQRNSMSEADLAAEGPPPELTELTSKQQTALTQRGYVDRERGVVAVGINRAMDLVVAELGSGKQPGEVIGPARPTPPPAKETADEEGGQPAAKEGAEADADSQPVTAKTTETQEPEDDES